VIGMPPTKVRMALPPLPRIENVSNRPFCPVAATPGVRTTQSCTSTGAATASR
jgi:hypothetical protein